MRVGCSLTALALTAAVAWSVSAQPASRVATTIDVLTKFPGVFHGRAVAIVAQPAQAAQAWELPMAAPRKFLVVPQSGAPPAGPQELRGIFFDLGRLQADGGVDARLELRTLLQRMAGDAPLPRDRVFGLLDASWVEPPDAASKSLRAVVLTPAGFEDRTVTVRGRFRGQNLFGDLPFWPRQSRWDFILQSADASLWVTNLRPRGNGFELDPASRRDAAAWIEVTGTVRTDGGIPRIEGTKLARSTAEAEPAPEPVVAAPPQPPPSVIFSAPLSGESGVAVGAPVLIQFSRDMAPASFNERVRVVYGEGVSDAVPGITVTYRPENRGVEVKFAGPLARGATVEVELQAGITASDGTPLAPLKISFTTQR
jgi:hypothetical protein